MSSLRPAHGIGLRLAHIEDDFTTQETEAFGQDVLRVLFAHGHGKARGGYPWKAVLPGWEPARLP